MTANIPSPIKIYHITHIDNLSSIIADAYLHSDAEVRRHPPLESKAIGVPVIKKRRLELELTSHLGLCIGECVPFYFCPRSIMLYVIQKRPTYLRYQGGQEPIVHLVSDLHKTVEWANKNGLLWAFTDSNAGSFHFEDFADLRDLDKIDWNAVQAMQ